ncbi:MAG TPA: ADOP family duplicated permease [Bryobacteraceae bacterium]|nr:ADOP family duplicated permease [Bryobacteraceae bacterium]
MSWMTRFANLFRQRRLDAELEEELASHVEEAIGRGRSAAEARHALGAALHYREQSRDIKLLPRLDALASDIVFGWRQINKHRAVSAAAILSLALATGATTAAFRLVDAVLLRTLPIAQPERLFYLGNTMIDPRDGHPDHRDDFDYPTFRRYRETLAGRADLMVVGYSSRQDATFGSSGETEKFYRQYVSGNMFGVFGLQPALGRLLTPDDDVMPGAHPVAVLSHDYWTRRFGRDPNIVGRSFRYANVAYEIVGVAPRGFTGTEPGVVTDVFLPAMMNVQAIDSPGWSWFRIWVRPATGVAPEQVRQPLQAALANEHLQRLENFLPNTPKSVIDQFLSESILLLPAASGASDLQRGYRRPLLILASLVALVLLVACANVGNLLAAQAAARAREMALRVSIGAGKWRLIQLVLVESTLLAVLASAAGALFSWWSAPLVVSMLAPPEAPVRLVLGADWRALAFGVALTVLVALGFGLAPALRASSVKPVAALKGGEDPHSRRGFMNSLIAGQMALCVLVLFMAALFVATFQRLSNRPLGFSYQRVLAMEVGSAGKEQNPDTWMQVAARLRQTPGVDSIAVSGWTLLSGNHWTASVRVPGQAAEPRSPYFLDVSPGFFETLRIGFVDGRDFRPGDLPPRVKGGDQPLAGVGIVNEAFTRKYFDGRNPVGRSVEVWQKKDVSAAMRIVGWVRDAAYSDVREVIRPVVYVPIQERNGATFIVRAVGDPRALAPILRRAVPQARSGFRVRNIDLQSGLVRRQMIHERLLATLSFFFAVLALVLAAIGLYGVLNYSVVRQRREIGIRMALGARSAHVVRRVTTGMLAMVSLGAAAGVAGGIASARVVETLLFGVRATDLGIVAAPLLTLLGAAVLAALPPAIRAVRIDPARTLRSE